jgi:3-oxoacyl-[acyl-carrier-protein] synthase II
MTHRVVVTGIGPVASVGIGREAFFEALMEQTSCPQPIPECFERNYTFKSRHYVALPEVSLAAHGVAQHFKSIMQHEDIMAVVAAKLALDDAGVALVKEDNRFRAGAMAHAAVIMGIGLSGLETAYSSHVAHMEPGTPLPAPSAGRRPRFNRMVVPMTMPNSVAAWISILFGFNGPSHTLNASCASGTCAIGEAFLRIRHGCDTVVVTGGVESLNDGSGGTMRGFDVLGVLTKSPDGRPTPFSETRSGFLFSEGGCCVLVLEELQHALTRGARIYAEIVDYRSNSDAHNIVQIDTTGRQVVSLLTQLKGDRKIDYLNAHGTGTRENDATEAAAIRSVFGDSDRQPLVGATKGLLGHTLGASGALEAAATALSIKHSRIHGTFIPQPVENLNLARQSVEKPVENAISVSLGFGGHNAGLLFTRVGADA